MFRFERVDKTCKVSSLVSGKRCKYDANVSRHEPRLHMFVRFLDAAVREEAEERNMPEVSDPQFLPGGVFRGSVQHA